MQDLVDSLVAQLGVTSDQARRGAGAILKAAHDRLGAAQFDQLLGNVGGVKDLLAHAPAPGGGLLGGLASMAGAFGNSDAAQGAKLLAAFASIGLNKDTLLKFVPVLMQFLQSQGGPELVAKVRAALKL